MSVTILLENPKTPFNVGSAVRAASCYGADGVMWTGKRVFGKDFHGGEAGSAIHVKREMRLPREERMRGYQDVGFGRLRDEREINVVFDAQRRAGSSIVAVELLRGAQPLTYFEHPTDALYLFGPEDGTLGKAWRSRADQFVFIPTRHCVNLAAAVYTILYDRMLKDQLAGRLPVLSMEESLVPRVPR